MATTLRRMTDEEIDSFQATTFDDYAEDRIAAGEDPVMTREVVAQQRKDYFPEGKPAPGHLLYRVLDDGDPVGILWIGPRQGNRPDQLWVYNIIVDEGLRGRGIGRAAMLLAEEEAKAHGAVELGLNVFGHNKIARNLYESLGYDTMAIMMRKPFA